MQRMLTNERFYHAGRNAQAAAREVAAAAGRMRGEAAAGAASAVAALRADVEALAARRGDDGDRVVARLDPRLTVRPGDTIADLMYPSVESLYPLVRLLALGTPLPVGVPAMVVAEDSVPQQGWWCCFVGADCCV